MANVNKEALHPKFLQLAILQFKDEDQQSTTTTDTFTLFPDLPTEIQLKIWNKTLSGRRFLKLAIFDMTHEGTTPWQIDSAQEAPVALSSARSLGKKGRECTSHSIKHQSVAWLWITLARSSIF
jgi:hypothetical protein